MSEAGAPLLLAPQRPPRVALAMPALSLRAKLVLSHLGLVLLAMAVAGLYLLHRMEQFYLAQLQEQLAIYAELLVEPAAQALETNQLEPLRTTLAMLDRESAVRVRIVDAAGRLIAATEAEDTLLVGLPVAAPGLDAALRGERVAVLVSNPPDPEVLYLALPVQRNGAVLGAVRVAYSLGDVAAEVAALHRALVVGLAGVGVLAVAIGVLLATRLAAPARRLAQAAQRLAAGDLATRCGESGGDEVARAAHAFDAMAERLESLQAARQQLLATVAHDLHSGTMALGVALEALERGAIDDPALRAELLRGMASHTRRLVRLADDLLETARLETGTLRLERQPVAPAALLRQAAAEFAAEAAERQVTLAVEAAEDLPLLEADPARLGQALANLLENALRHTPAGSVVRLTAQRRGGAVALAVTDRGPGPPPLAQGPPDGLASELRAPAAAQTEHPSLADCRSGRLGLGLTIVRGIAEAHGGWVEATSAPGGGACFAIVLPVPACPGGAPDAPVSDASPALSDF
jgi:signal transduction histidine kinase